MRSSLWALLPLLATVAAIPGPSHQLTFNPDSDSFNPSTSPEGQGHPHAIDLALYDVLMEHRDPVDAMLALDPESEAELGERRLVQVLGEDEVGPVWMTEGDKLRLRREGKKFMDLTEHQDTVGFRTQNIVAAKPNLPELNQQRFVKPCFADIDKDHMHNVLRHMTSYYNRYYHHVNGAKSATWLHNHIAGIIAESPFQTYISLEYQTHKFLQPSVIARFEPPVRNASLPLTIIGAHQDSANYMFPLLPAPGADDDMSGSVSILEAFRVLAKRGFIPARGPVEFHWYAAEEAGLLGSQDIAAFKKGQGANIGAMMEFDMTAFIHRNATESINFITDQANDDLTNWAAGLSKEYVDVLTRVTTLGTSSAGSDYMSFSRQGFPSSFATEGDPVARGKFPGDFDSYIHTTRDTMDIDDETGVFSVDHMAHFTQLAIAFAVEQADWSLKHTRADDGQGTFAH